MVKIGAVILGIIAIVGGFSGCAVVHDPGPAYVEREPGPPPWAPAHGHRAHHRYYYYPESAVYFDVGRNLYFYSVGGTWRSSVTLPVGIHVDLASYSVLEMDADRPYIYHGDVERRYPPGQMKKGPGKDKGKKGKWW